MFTSKTKFIQLIVTLAACAFLFVPMVLSVMAGVTNLEMGFSRLGTLCRQYLSVALVGYCLSHLDADYRITSSLWTGAPPRLVIPYSRRVHITATCSTGTCTSIGLASTLRLHERFSYLLDVHTCWPHLIHVTIYGAIYFGRSCIHGS